MPTAEDHVQATFLERRLRQLLGGLDEAALMEQSKTWDYDMNRKLTLKEFFQFLVVAGLEDVATPAATQVLFDKMDVVGSDTLSVQEIYEWLQSGEEDALTERLKFVAESGPALRRDSTRRESIRPHRSPKQLPEAREEEG